MPLVDPQRMRRALELFGEAPGGPDALMTTYECLHVEAQRRTSLEPDNETLRDVARMLEYSVFGRTSEVCARLDLINWMQASFWDKKGDDSHPWSTYAALAIKDFHFDVSALMDSVAPVLIQATDGLKKEDRKKLPGFPDIQCGTKRTYRKRMPDDVIALVDDTDRWWPFIKEYRDTLAHRQHDKIIFGPANRGVLFQLYDPALLGRKLVVDPAFLWPKGNDIADFRLYLAFVLGELLVFLDEVGKALASHLDWPQEELAKCGRVGNYQYLLQPLSELAKGLPA